MKEFITSDIHFFHKNIIKYNPKYRPYENIQEMNEGIIEHWNSIVSPEDIIYHLGDFAFGGKEKIRGVMDQLNGEKIFILGNHDNLETMACFGEVHHYLEINRQQTKIIMCHYPIESWNGMHRGSIMLHGHSHGSLESSGRRLDVGYDSLGKISLLDDVISDMLNEDIVLSGDHHNDRKK